jgi:hypothetical protein
LAVKGAAFDVLAASDAFGEVAGERRNCSTGRVDTPVAEPAEGVFMGEGFVGAGVVVVGMGAAEHGVGG